MPTFYHGKSADFQWNSNNIGQYADSIDFPRTADKADTSVFGLTAKTYVVGLLDSTISISGKFDATESGVLAADYAAGASRTWIYGPAGSTSTYVKYTGSGFITKYDEKATIGGAVTFTAEIQVSGAVTRTTY